MIGLGLTAVGFGVRYAMMDKVNPDTHAQIGATSLTILLTVLGCGLAVGLAVAFLGLMYHHERRHRELLRHPEARTVP